MHILKYYWHVYYRNNQFALNTYYMMWIGGLNSAGDLPHYLAQRVCYFSDLHLTEQESRGVSSRSNVIKKE